MFRVIIAGGKDFDDYDLVVSTMDKLLLEYHRTDYYRMWYGKRGRHAGRNVCHFQRI